MIDTESSPPLHAGLYIVATPIGNLGDLSLRAADILRRADLIACEDTRVTGKLLRHIEADTKMLRYDDHASERVRAQILDAAREGAVALVSDAGTPLISDPGYRLIAAARAADIALTSIPGPCAAITALTLSGLPSDSFVFGGFLPVKEKARRDKLLSYEGLAASLIFYESGPRLVKSLRAVAELWPGRALAVARELTKLHEECRTGPAAALAEYYTAHPPKGEIVLMIGPPEPSADAFDDDAVEAMLAEALKTMKPSKAAAMAAKATGLERAELYRRALALREAGSAGGGANEGEG